MKEDKYFLLVPYAVESYDYQTEYENYIPKNYGLEFSSFPTDDLMEFDSKYYCTERMYYSLFNPQKNFNNSYKVEIISKNVRVTKNANWLSNHDEASIPIIYEITFLGTAFRDDLGLIELKIEHPIVGLYKHKFLIASEKAIVKLVINHCPYISGQEVKENEKSKFPDIQKKLISNWGDNFLVNMIPSFNKNNKPNKLEDFY